MKLWSEETERDFFRKALEIATPEQLFYLTDDGRYLAYWPKEYRGERSTLQSRNSIIGSYTEKWTKELLEPIAEEFGLYAVHNVVCEEIGLGKMSPADVALSRSKSRNQKPEDISLIVEVKMSVVWNWEYVPDTKELKCIGDYSTHQGNPGLLRSDSMLKAIGKSINIRVSGFESSGIPIIIMGNTPITESYHSKVDHLKKAGIIQGFYSVNPNPIDGPQNIKSTPEGGFLRIDDFSELEREMKGLLSEDREFFSSMLTRTDLGKLIEIAAREESYEKKAEKFLELLRGEQYHR